MKPTILWGHVNGLPLRTIPNKAGPKISNTGFSASNEKDTIIRTGEFSSTKKTEKNYLDLRRFLCHADNFLLTQITPSSSLGNRNIIRVRYLGVKNSKLKDTSKFLSLCPCLHLWCFRSIFGRFTAIPARFSSAVVWYTVEPPVSDHPKCKDWVVAYGLTGGGRLQESNHRALLPRKGPGTSCTLWKIIYCMQRLSYEMCSSMLSKTMKNHQPRPKKWSQLFTEGGLLLEFQL